MELTVREDHIHAVLSIPLKRKPYWGNRFWSRGYFVSTIGLDEKKIRWYVKYQEENERLEEDQRKEFSPF